MSATPLPTIEIAPGKPVPVLGQGTWHFAEQKQRRQEEVNALRLGIDLGMTLIDTAEMYANGNAEKLVGQAVAGLRDKVFLVSKVLPHHATRVGTIAACEQSLLRLDTDYLDLYLLHWRGPVPLEETLAGMAALIQGGKIRHWGVSNFDLADIKELIDLRGGSHVVTNQVLYNLARRGIEYDLLPWCQAQGIRIMAYSPIEQGRILHDGVLHEVARRHQATSAQIALAWVLRQTDVIAIPGAGSQDHVREDRRSADIELTELDLADLDKAFPPPKKPQPLEML